MKPLLVMEAVTCKRGGRLLFEALDVNLGPGEAVQVTGPNGSGKSSLLRLAAGLLRPEAGRVSSSASLALADTSLALDRELSLGAALGFWGGSIDEAMRALAIDPLAQVPVRLLSTGQARRASIARVAASRAALWLLDEPANGLDDASAQLLSGLLARHRLSGGAVLAASHIALPGEWRTLELSA